MKIFRALSLAFLIAIPAAALAGPTSLLSPSCCPGPCCDDGGCPMCPNR